MKRIDPIVYILVDAPQYLDRVLFYHLSNRSDAAHLRCLMTLLMLPADVSDIDVQRPMFSAAIHRLTTSPLILKIHADKELEKLEWSYLLDAPLIIVFVIDEIPHWVYELIRLKQIGLLTPYDEIANVAKKEPSLHVGLLKGFSDLEESYRVIGELIKHCSSDDRVCPETRSTFNRLRFIDLFSSRSRLTFIPPIPLAAPEQGRPAAYMLNRLSNNVDAPSLISPNQAGDPETSLALPRMLDYSIATCMVFAGLESKLPFPTEFALSLSDMEGYYAKILSDVTENEKMKLWMKIGAKITGDKALRSPILLSVPAARVDLLKNKLPPTLIEEPGHREFMDIKMRVLSDCINKRPEKVYQDEKKKEVYKSSKETLILGHRLMAVQTSYLGISATAVPIQAPEIGGKLFSAANELDTAFRKRTRKVTALFQRFEIQLAESLPKTLLAHLILGDSPVIFYSDLPYEWTLLDNWPICLTRPVSRIPISGTSSWLALTHMSKQKASININHPDRVLVLDLISEHDPVRNFSDLFRRVSEGIGQGYIYKKPFNPEELAKIINDVSPEIVVLDTHGNYQRMFDNLLVYLGDRPANLGDFLPDVRIPPVWILSACDMAVVGAVGGSMVSRLLEKGAISVVATLGKIDAYAAAMFVGRLLTDIYSPHPKANFKTFSDVFFISQLTTALLYDPLFPLLRKAHPRTKTSEALFKVIFDYARKVWSSGITKPRDFRYKAAEILSDCLKTHGLSDKQLAAVKSGEVIPETLLFTAFGIPMQVELEKDQQV